jgi:phage terminase small subunit
VSEKLKTAKKVARKTLPKAAARQPAAKRQSGKPRKTEKKIETSAIDFCGVKLTALRRGFIIHYCTPGQPCFHNALQAAIKAGYREATAKTDIYEILRLPDIQKIIKKNESIAHQDLHSAAMRALELKQRRAFFDPLDFFEKREIIVKNKKGEQHSKSIMNLRPLEEMTPEQRMCIDGIDIKGAGEPVYLMADRERELSDIIKIDNELSKYAVDTVEEEMREIIMERITIRETKRAQRKTDVEYEIVEMPDPDTDAEEEEE